MEKEKNEDNSLENNINKSDSSLSSLNNKNSEELIEELKIAKNEIEYYRNLYEDTFNKLKYSLADLDNYRKTAEKQNSLKILSLKSTLLTFVIDMREDFIRAIEIIKQNNVDKSIFEGLENILKNINIFLEKEGIKEIESLNGIFDPNFHEIIGFSYNDDIEENIITKEIRKGYLFNDRVLRPSLVEVSKKIVKNIDDNNNIKGDKI